MSETREPNDPRVDQTVDNSTAAALSRRAFLARSGAWLAGSLVLSWNDHWIGKLAAAAAADPATVATFSPNPFIAIGPDGHVTLVCHRSEMGQGIRTSIAMLLCEELDVDVAAVTLEQSVGDEIKYGDQNTDGSKSIVLNWKRLREAAAAARQMLVTAAAQSWGVAPESCTTHAGRVLHASSGRRLAYGDVAAKAAALPVPEHAKTKDDKDFRIVGKPMVSVDVDAMINGRAVYGIDAVLPGMVYASLERSPTVNGKLKSLDASAAMAVPGVLKVVPLAMAESRKYANDSVAVVATSTWSARQGRTALKIEWDGEKGATTSELRATAFAALDKPGKVYKKDGDFEAAERTAARTLQARYYAPHLAHATMEPPACLARVDDHGCEIWAPSQDPQGARNAAAKALAIPVEKVTVNVTMIGGGFGRKSQHDFVVEAVVLAKQLGRPVKVTWTREDEIRHGFYHPLSAQELKATLDASGKITGWRHRTAFTPIAHFLDPANDAPAPFEVGMGVTNLPYNLPNILCEGAGVATDVRIAWLRSVCNIFHAFSVNSFLDELAHETGRDAVDLRLSLLDPKHRFVAVIKKIAAESGWGRRRPKGTGLGFACHFSFRSFVAAALEVSVKKGELRVHRADIAIDCGKYVNPDSVRAQLEGSVNFALSAALYGEITMTGGATDQSNFDGYPMLRMPEAPEIRTHIIDSGADSCGVGEPGVPPIAPALTSAIFAATGRRIRELPVARQLG